LGGDSHSASVFSLHKTTSSSLYVMKDTENRVTAVTTVTFWKRIELHEAWRGISMDWAARHRHVWLLWLLSGLSDVGECERACSPFDFVQPALNNTSPDNWDGYWNASPYMLLACDVWYKKGKGKVISLQAWRGPEVSRRLRLPDFKTIGTWRW